jgi:hypothetical protein
MRLLPSQRHHNVDTTIPHAFTYNFSVNAHLHLDFLCVYVAWRYVYTWNVVINVGKGGGIAVSTTSITLQQVPKTNSQSI